MTAFEECHKFVGGMPVVPTLTPSGYDIRKENFISPYQFREKGKSGIFFCLSQNLSTVSLSIFVEVSFWRDNYSGGFYRDKFGMMAEKEVYV